MNKKTTHGGKRKGAGRKNMLGSTKMKSIKLPIKMWEKAKKIGDGNLTEGIRKSIGEFPDLVEK